MYGSTRPIKIEVDGKRNDYDTLSYVAPSKMTRDEIMFAHTQNVSMISSALWRMVRPLHMVSKTTRVMPYDLVSDNRMFVVPLYHLFPGIAHSKIANWWLNNLKKTRIDYESSIGTLSRRFGLIVPIVSTHMTVDETVIKLCMEFSRLLGYDDDKSLSTIFSCHIPLDSVSGTTNREKAETIIRAIPQKKKHLRSRLSLVGHDIPLLNKIASRLHTRVTVDYDKAVPVYGVRIDNEDYVSARGTWAHGPGSTGTGMLVTRQTNVSRLERLVKHFEKNWYNTIILDMTNER